jgi:DNA-binding NarL/FixJ family response regulator
MKGAFFAVTERLRPSALAAFPDVGDRLFLLRSEADERGIAERVRAAAPDVLVVDIGAVMRLGYDVLIPALRHDLPPLKVLVVAPSVDVQTMHQALEVGATGSIEEGADAEALAAAVGRARRGAAVFPEWTPTMSFARERYFSATRRYEVLRAVADGASTRALAERLGITELTVRTHLRNVMIRLGGASVEEAVSIARERGLLPPIEWPGESGSI